MFYWEKDSQFQVFSTVITKTPMVGGLFMDRLDNEDIGMIWARHLS
jgi:hypothetical protein